MANVWEYRSSDSKIISVPVKPLISCNSAETEAALAVAGVGIARLPSLSCEHEIETGKLIPILADFETPPGGVYAIYSSRAHLAAKVRVFIDFLSEKFAQSSKV